MPKNLIYILNSYSSTESSHFHHVIHLLDKLADDEVDITLLIEKASSIPEFTNSKIRVVCLNETGFNRALELYRFIKSECKIKKNSIFIRITSLSACISWLASRRSGSMVFFWQSGTTHEWDFAQALSLKKVVWYLKSYLPSYFARKTVDRFVTGPEYMVNYYDKVVGVKREKIRLLYNDIQLERFETTPDKVSAFKAGFIEKYPLAKNKKIILLVHNMSPVRKTTMYIPSSLKKAYDEFEDIVFLVVGGGAELPDIKKSIKNEKMEDRFIFTGSIPNKEIQMLYIISDVFIHPTYNEGFPRVMLEAMAAGLPFVSTDAGGVFDITPTKLHKFISSRDSVVDFSENLIEMLRSEDEWLTYGNIEREYVKQFDTTVIAKMYKRVLFDD